MWMKEFKPLKIPASLYTMMTEVYLKVLPDVHRYLNDWKERAGQIPDPELQKQALMSIKTKTFHCEGGSILGLLAGENRVDAIRFIVAYQTISDYLDNLCDRSTSLDPIDFRALHESMLHALTPEARCLDYYRFRNERDDGGYLVSLVQTCQEVLRGLPSYDKISPVLYELAGYYCDLQVHKHVKVEERVPRLEDWFQSHRDKLPEMSWYEFSACCGSTLGIFCLVAYACHDDYSADIAPQVRDAYFPWVQGLHILLDYLIDQEEDGAGGDLNFCFYYENSEEMLKRLTHFFKQADRSVSRLPNTRFHQMINRGLLGVYLSDKKIERHGIVYRMAKKIVRLGGWPALFFCLNGWIYRRIREQG